MKKIIFILFIGLIVLFSVSAQPGIKFNDTRHDFGNVPDGSYPTWSFKFVNTGNEDLKLSDVKASCGCTSPQWTREPIKPGDSGEVKVVFNSAGYAGRSFAKSVTITTNVIENGEPKKEFLFIQGKVMNKVTESPQYPVKFSENIHNLGTIKSGKKATWPLIILNDGDSTITIKEIKSTCPYIIIQQGNYTIAPHQSIGINITLKTKGLEPKTLHESIKVTTNLPVKITKLLSETGYGVTAIVSGKKK